MRESELQPIKIIPFQIADISNLQNCSCFCDINLVVVDGFYWVTYCTYLPYGAESFWEANSFTASQEIPHTLWNPKVHYRNHKCPPPVPILSQLDPVHTPISHFLKITLNIILLSMPGSPKWALSLRFHHQNTECASSFPIYATCPAQLMFLECITWTIMGEDYI